MARTSHVTVVRTTLMILLLAVIPLAAHAAESKIAGTWTLTVDLGGQGGTATFTFEEKEAGKITGKYSGAVGEAPVTGTIDGDKVSFSFEGAQVGKVTYEGTVDGDHMKGTCSYGQLGSGTFDGSRKKG